MADGAVTRSTRPVWRDTLRGARNPRATYWLLTAASVTVVVLLWWLVTALFDISPVLFPGPGAVWDAAVLGMQERPVAEGVDRTIKGYQNYYLWEHLLASLQRIGAGVGIAVLVAVPLGLLMASVRWFGLLLDPYLNFLRSLPPLAYIGLLIVWFGFGDAPKIWLLFLAAFPPIAIATISGVRGVREDQINAVRTLGATRRQVLVHVTLPATLPEIFTGFRVAVGFAWTTVVAAEIQNGIPGIGGLAYISGSQNQTDVVIACIIIIGITAILLDQLVKVVEDVLVPWRGRA
jgi:taurine transport system permease protein